MAFKYFKFGLNDSNLHSNVSNSFRIVRICIQMVRISLNMHSNTQKPFQMVRFCIWMPQMLEFLSKCLNLHLNGSNLVQMVRFCVRMFPFPFKQNLHSNASSWFECFKFAFESLSNGYNLHLNASSLVWTVWIFLQTHWVPFERLKFALECFDSCLNSSNLHSNG